MAFRLYKPVKDTNIVLAMFDTQYDLCSTLIRMQEYYESDSDRFRGRVFPLDEYMDYYASKHGGKFSYFTDWNGFNLPGNVISGWEYAAEWSMRTKESEFLTALHDFSGKDLTDFYVIACHQEDTDKEFTDVFAHEVSHALYYLDRSYSESYANEIKELSDRVSDAIDTFLGSLGYAQNVFMDELIAYLATSPDAYVKSKMRISPKVAKPFKQVFQQWYDHDKMAPKLKKILETKWKR